MKALEIDKLVRWAIVDELPKGRPVAASPWDRLVSYGRLGTRVDISGYGSGGGLGIVPGTPHPDAERIGDAIAALPKNAQLMEEDCAALLGTYAQLDAETVRRSSGRKRYDLQGLMVRNAILGAPKIDCERPYPASLRHVANGRVIVHSMREGQIEEARAHPKNGGYHHLAAPQCLLNWRGIGPLLEARAEFALWHVGLGMLVDALAGRLEEHTAIATKLPARPWLSGETKPPRILRTKATAKLSRLPLKPERPRAAAPL